MPLYQHPMLGATELPPWMKPDPQSATGNLLGMVSPIGMAAQPVESGLMRVADLYQKFFGTRKPLNYALGEATPVMNDARNAAETGYRKMVDMYVGGMDDAQAAHFLRGIRIANEHQEKMKPLYGIYGAGK